jgi:hypothetical protein
MGLLNLLMKNPLEFFLIAIPLLYSIIFHELAHGWVANCGRNGEWGRAAATG